MPDEETKVKDTMRLGGEFELLRRKMAGKVLAKFFEVLFKNTPAEDGHSHEAWMTAAEQLIGGIREQMREANKVVAANEDKRSHDPIARQHGQGDVVEDKSKLTVKLHNRFSFVHTLEYGGTIRPISPGGRKVPPVVERPGPFRSARHVNRFSGTIGPSGPRGPLFGDRESNGGGMVFWRDKSGSPHMAPARSLSPGRFVDVSLNTAMMFAGRMGATARRM